MNRRDFLVKSSTAASVASSVILLPNLALAQTASSAKNYSIVDERQKILAPSSQRYAYTQDQIQTLKNQEGQVIDNQILPNSYKPTFWDQPRQLFLQRAQTGEKLNITYYQNGKIDLNGYWYATYFLRDIRQSLMAYPDLKLLDLMCAVQAWMRMYGNQQPLIITSGYRTQKTNDAIEGSARNSMHMMAKAVDFVVPGLDPLTIGKIAMHFQAGGVGIYLDKKFNHLDTSSVRTWVQGNGRKRR